MTAIARHRAAPAGRRPLRSLAVGTAALTVSLTVAVGAAGVTYSFMSDSAAVGGATITAGAAALTVNDVTNYTVSGLDTTKLLPGQSVVSQPLLIENGGDVPLEVEVVSAFSEDTHAALAAALTVVLRPSATCAPTSGAGVSQAVTQLELGVGESGTYCLEVGLPSGAPAAVEGKRATFTISLDAVQVVS